MGNPFVLTAITADAAVAAAADAAGVDRIGIDIEQIGKLERQRHVPDAKFSEHRMEDLAVVAKHTSQAERFVRLNPLHDGSRREIERALSFGAQVLMLPYFTQAREVASFIELVAGRATPVLLLETAAAVANIDDIVNIRGVSEIVVGLNDLHLSLGLSNLFEVVVSERMTTIASRVRDAGMRFGFGGLARPADRTLPVNPDLVCAQYARLGATSAWLSRSFFAGMEPEHIGLEVALLRQRLHHWAGQSPSTLEARRRDLAERLRELGSA